MNIRVCREGAILYVPAQECTELELRAFCHEQSPDKLCNIMLALLSEVYFK